jgi:hypothetical protein
MRLLWAPFYGHKRCSDGARWRLERYLLRDRATVYSDSLNYPPAAHYYYPSPDTRYAQPRLSTTGRPPGRPMNIRTEAGAGRMRGGSRYDERRWRGDHLRIVGTDIGRSMTTKSVQTLKRSRLPKTHIGLEAQLGEQNARVAPHVQTHRRHVLHRPLLKRAAPA